MHGTKRIGEDIYPLNPAFGTRRQACGRLRPYKVYSRIYARQRKISHRDLSSAGSLLPSRIEKAPISSFEFFLFLLSKIAFVVGTSRRQCKSLESSSESTKRCATRSRAVICNPSVYLRVEAVTRFNCLKSSVMKTFLETSILGSEKLRATDRDRQ